VRGTLVVRTSAMGPDAGILERQHPEQALKQLLAIALGQCNLY
jgi:hypothetical protein